MPAKTNSALTELKKQLKNGVLAPIYIFFGEEEYLKDTYVKRVASLVGDGGFPEFNHIFLEGERDFSEYDDALESVPMMAEKKLVHIKDSGIFKTRRAHGDRYGTEELKDFWTEKLSRNMTDTVIIFDERNADKRSALYKAASKAGLAVEFTYLSDADLVTWVIKQCLNAKKRISKENAYYLVSRCDPGLNNLNNELGKLLDFCGEEIYKSDIDRLVSKSTQTVVFELTDAIIRGDANTAVTVIRDSRAADSRGAFALLYLMLSSFEKMLHVKAMDGASAGEIASAIGASPYMARRYIDNASRFSYDTLAWMTGRIAEIDLAIKEGETGDWQALEQFAAECVSKNFK